MLFETPGNGNEHDAQWVVLTNNSQLIQSPKLLSRQTVLTRRVHKDVFWSDDYSSLLSILKALN
jgi:hypothetical protein